MTDDKLKKERLYLLGEMIRERGQKTPKKHGNYWKFLLGEGLYFSHDDFNHSVSLRENGMVLVHYGVDFGRFECEASMYDFDKALGFFEALNRLHDVSLFKNLKDSGIPA